jgi:hypothetical protein
MLKRFCLGFIMAFLLCSSFSLAQRVTVKEDEGNTPATSSIAAGPVLLNPKPPAENVTEQGLAEAEKNCDCEKAINVRGFRRFSVCRGEVDGVSFTKTCLRAEVEDWAKR